MNTTTISVIASGISSFFVYFGVKFIDFLIKRQESTTRLSGKEFDDGIERRKELLKEIEEYKVVIRAKDLQIGAHLDTINRLKDQIRDDSIKYIRLEGRYNEAVGDLETFSLDLALKFKNAGISNLT